MKRISFIGAAGTGKTTLLDALVKHYSGQDEVLRYDLGLSDEEKLRVFEQGSPYVVIEELVRSLCRERGYDSPYNVPGDEINQFRFDLLLKQIEIEEQLVKDAQAYNKAQGKEVIKGFMGDRGCLDGWAYYMRWSWNSVDVEVAEDYYTKARKQSLKYDHIVFVPMMFETPEDGFRWVNKTYQDQMERLQLSVVQEWMLEEQLYCVQAEALNERIKELQELLDSN